MPAKAEIDVSRGYELLDFGEGRKLERFGDFTTDRPSPAAEGSRRRRPNLWERAHFRFLKTRGETGEWKASRGGLPTEWTMRWAELTFRIRPNPSGNVGLFPEAATVWRALRPLRIEPEPPLRMLNLFAYTGGATLAAAAAGAHVVHVDSSAASVSVARENASLSGLAEAPIRWIVEDARKFVQREVRREQSYDLVLLDPPTWGHGPKGQAWRFEEDLDGLLDDAAALVRAAAGRIVLTGHAPGWDAERARRHLLERTKVVGATAHELSIAAADGRTLPAGWIAVASFAEQGRFSSERDDA
ncbi:MAG TPA: class I SAM-dependent methyltransferase [Pirellulaceae bacterium]|jgi:23S rRNA (cytosine1962-C5)-methyltransferase|nr:class I SAM-dependent methyltransferase [Pirellulaceae bacterium]